MKKLFLFALMGWLSHSIIAQNKPNVIVILADDLGSADLSFRGSDIQTPSLDKMANEGLVLNNFYVHPVCTPTRAAMLTGKEAMHLGFQSGVIRAWEAMIPDRGLPVNERTMAEEFQEAGYNTLMFGKWHLGESSEEFMPWNRGFDYFYGHLSGHIDYFTKLNAGGYDWRRNKEVVREDGYATYLITDDVVNKINSSNSDQPFFMYVAYNAPHSPLQAPEEAKVKYKDMPANRRTYAAMVTEMDKGIGEIIDALEEKGILENTILFFTSDNGGVASKSQPSSNGELRGSKGTIFDGGVKVPGIFMWKGHIKTAESTELMHITDIYPTLVGMTSVSSSKVNPKIDGLDCTDFVLNQAASPRSFIVPNMYKSRAGIISGEWKLSRNPRSKTEKGPIGEMIDGDYYLLCNLSKDPGETVNLVKKNKKKFKELRKLLEEHEKTAVTPFKRVKPPKEFEVPEIWGEKNSKMIKAGNLH